MSSSSSSSIDSSSSSSLLYSSSSSSSSSMDSSSSSSSSLWDKHSNKILPFTYEQNPFSPVWCLAYGNGNIFAATGDQGIVLKSSNGYFWDTYYKTDDIHVTALFEYNGILYMGTSPNGIIYISALSTDQVELSQTVGGTVSCFVYFNGNFYASTSNPSNIYRYNNITNNWDMWYKPYSTMINKMIVSGDGKKMFIFINSSNVLVYDGNEVQITELTWAQKTKI